MNSDGHSPSQFIGSIHSPKCVVIIKEYSICSFQLCLDKSGIRLLCKIFRIYMRLWDFQFTEIFSFDVTEFGLYLQENKDSLKNKIIP